ncbi:MAG: InlB B-repeat-containing protein [Chitinispirillia bacterium]|nr:InlB B-repeat-containing protein [Chitinispirillia bacterium]
MRKTLFMAALFTIFLTGIVNAQNGWMSRYWDGCKQSCSWINNAGGAANACKECDRSNNRLTPTSDANRSSCNGGNSFTCWDMIPYAVNDNLAYGFVATNPPNRCGSCYEITFTGTGEHSTNDNHRAIQGKRMIVMAANIGGDVGSTQFDLMVPGGGLGLYDSFTGQTGISTQALGHQYGGILRQFCETGTAAAQRTCLRDRCNSVFSAANHALLRQGCVFYADWLMAASNPRYTMRSVDCPQELRDVYSGARIGGGPGTGPQPTAYTITFNANSGTVTPATATTGTGGTLATLPTPARSGFTFDGWFTAATGGTAVTTSTVFTANATIWARWTAIPANTFTITFNANGGTVTPTSAITGTNGRLTSLPAPTRSGNTFSGWFTAQTGGTEVTTNTVFTSNSTIWARWTAIPTFTLTVNRNPTAGGNVSQSAQSNITAGTQVTITANPAQGYTFNNWTITGTGTIANASSASTSVTVNGNVTVTANFTQIPVQPTNFTLTINRNPTAGGTVTPASGGSHAAGTPVNISAAAATGYTFSNWTVTGSGATIANSNSAATTVTLTANAVITANFTQIPVQPTNFTLIINRSPTAGGTVVPSSGQSHPAGTPVNISADAATGYTFVNWTITGSGAAIANVSLAATTVTLTANATITANFQQQGGAGCAAGEVLTLRVMGSGAINVTPQRDCYPSGQALTLVAVPSEGWVFDRWDGGAWGNDANHPASDMWHNREITAHFRQSEQTSVKQVLGVHNTRTQVVLRPSKRGFSAMLPNNHGYHSYSIVDLTGREIKKGKVYSGASELHFDNVRNSTLFLRLKGNNTTTVLRTVTF